MKTSKLEFPEIKKKVLRKMTQTEAAELLGISPSYMYLLTYGFRPITDELRKKMAKIGIREVRK